jgi:hypothetical protein
MNLGETKRAYSQILADFEDLASSGKGLSEDDAKDAEQRLDAVHKNAMRQIDYYTTRRFLPVNARRGLVSKLDRLHQQSCAELRAISGR